ncbi:FeoB small GTPase domain-containing protein, partial [Moorena sp. SIO4A5]
MTSCHNTSTAVIEESKGVKRVALLGMPNTGKSTFFNRITGTTAHVGNWPGITVDLLQANVQLNGEPTEFVDLPGIYDLKGFSDDEKIVKTFLENFAVDLFILVLNASQIDSQIRLALQVKSLGLPAVLMLNMADEAKQYGVKINTELLSDNLDMPVLLISAKYGDGYMRAYLEISKTLKAQEQSINIDNLKTRLSEHSSISTKEIDSVLNGAVEMPSEMAVNLTARIDKLLLHPILGLPLFFLGMFLVFWVVWTVGLPSQDLMDDMTGWIQGA